MKKIINFLRGISFVIAVILGFYAADFALSRTYLFERSRYLPKNEYESIIAAHGGAVSFDKVVYGNTALISAYIESRSQSGYVSFGMESASLTELYSALSSGHLRPRGDLVVLLNPSLISGGSVTQNPWNRKPYIPYIYHNRGQVLPVVYTYGKSVIKNRSLSPANLTQYPPQTPELYYGILTDAELDRIYQDSAQNDASEDYDSGLDSLRKIITYCAKNNIVLRAAIAPRNSYISIGETEYAALKSAAEICEKSGIEVYDMTDLFPRKCFYDLERMNAEYGAIRFTEVLDIWLNS